MLILRIQVCFFLTYRALKVAGNYRPERRKMGFDLRTFGAMLGGIYHKKCCLQSLLLLLASIGFVIKSRLPLIRPLSLASIAFVMTGVLARLSFSLSKHCLCHYDVAWLAFVSFTLMKKRDFKRFCEKIKENRRFV